jgi:hypothetical protein
MARDTANKIGSAFGGVGGQIAKAMAAVGIGLSAAALAGWIRGAINAADAAAKLARSAGVASKDVAGLQLAFRQSGLTDQDLTTKIGRLNKQIADGAKAFEAMGISTRNTDGSLKGARQMLGEVADRFKGYEDGAAKAALAQELFGKGGERMISLLNGGAESLAAFDDMAQRLGLTLDEKTQVAAEQFNDTLDLIGQAGQGVARQVAAQLLPTLNTLAAEMFRSVTEGDRLTKVSNALAGAMKGLYSVAVGVVTAFQTVGKALGGVAAAIAAILRGDFGQVKGIIAEMRQDITENWQRAGAGIQRVWEGAGDASVSALAATMRASKEAAPVVAGVGRSARTVRDEFSKLADQLAGKIVDGWAAAEAGAQGYNRAQQDFLRLTASPQWAAFTSEQRAQIAILSEKLILQEQEAAAVKALAEAQEAARKAYADSLSVFKSAAESAEKRVQDMEQEARALEIAEALQVGLAEAIEMTVIARLKEQQILAMGNEEAVMAIQREIDAREKLIGMMRDRRVQDASVKAAQDAAAEWQKASDKIEDMLTDALMRGFENGKGFGQNLADSIKNLFKTYVAQAIAKAITGAIMAALAQTAWARALSGIFGGGGGGMGGMAMNAASSAAMNSMFGGGGGAGFAASAGQLAGGVALNAMGAGGAGYAMAVPGLTSAAAGSQAAMLAAQTSGFGAAGVTATAAAGGSTAAAGASAATSALSAIPVWGWIALAAVVFWDDLFGRKLKEAGSMLSIRGDEITSTGFEFRKGGMFRSDKWTETGDRTAQDQQLIQQFRNVQQSSAAMAQALGYSADTINGFTGTVRVNLKGVKTAEEAQKRLNDALEDFQWQLWRSVPGMDMTKEKFKQMLAEVQQSIEKAGISAQGIADVIMAGMLGRMDQAQVGQALADNVLGGIYQTIASPFANQIAQAFQAQIITPVFTAILAGVPISQAISQQAIANVVATAQQAAATLNAIFSDAGFRQAIGDIQTAIGGIAAASVQPARQIRGLSSSMTGAGNAARSARLAWRALTDSIIEEIRRLRGEIVGDGAPGLAFAQSQFAIATAQARAGDRDAAGRLPELSRQVQDLLRLNSGTLSEFMQGQSTLLASLTETAQVLNQRFRLRIPGFAVGTNYVTNDMLAMIHKGEAIVPKAYNPAAGGGADKELIGELIREVQGLRAEVRADVGHNAQSAKMLTRAMAREGDAFAVREAEA